MTDRKEFPETIWESVKTIGGVTGIVIAGIIGVLIG